VIDIAPGEVAPGDEWRAHGLEESRCDEPEAVNRKVTRRIFPVPYEDSILPPVTVHGDTHGKANRRNTWNRLNLAQDFLLHADDLLGILGVSVGNVDAECLKLLGFSETRVNSGEGMKCPDHEP